jgi:dihydroorotase
VPKAYIIRNATLINPGHTNHLKKSDILISNGKINKIATRIKSGVKDVEISGEEVYVSSGWLDLRVHLSDPGEEHKDSLSSLLETASSGGFTGICTLPNSKPAIGNKAAVQYLLKNAEASLVNLYPTGLLSDAINNENLSELYDMHNAGAVAFTNGDYEVSNGVLKKALLYTKPFGAPVITHSMDGSLHKGGLINESENTIHTGLKTSPALAEFIAVRQHLEIAKYCDAPIHLSNITTKESVELIAAAKKKGQQVTCDASIFHLCFTDSEVISFNENFKIYPPLRGEKDRKALIKAVNNGVIDAITSNHTPQDIESKRMEFDYAEFGSLSIPFVYPWYLKYLSKQITLDVFIEKFTSGASGILGLNSKPITTGESANLTVFDARKKWMFNENTNHSLSRNTHMWNQEIEGGVIAVFNNNKVKTY